MVRLCVVKVIRGVSLWYFMMPRLDVVDPFEVQCLLRYWLWAVWVGEFGRLSMETEN